MHSPSIPTASGTQWRLLAVASAALALTACGGSDSHRFNFDDASKELATQKVAESKIGLPTKGATVTSIQTPSAVSGAQPPASVRANISMMKYVYARRIDIKPGVVKVRTRLQSPIGRLALANSIALTPGSLVLDLKDDTLFIHWLDVQSTDVDEATSVLVAPFETHLEKVFG